MQYPVQVRRNVRLRIIPISELDEAPLIDNQHEQKRKGYKTMSLNELLEKYPPKEKEE